MLSLLLGPSDDCTFFSLVFQDVNFHGHCGTRTYLGYHILYLTLFSVMLLWCSVLMWSNFIAAGLEERGVGCSFFLWTCCHYTKSDVKAWTLHCLLTGFYLHNHLVTTVKRWCLQTKVSVCTCVVIFVGLAAAIVYLVARSTKATDWFTEMVSSH